MPETINKPLRAGIGKHVVLELVTVSETERIEVDIVANEYADLQNGFLAASTPLARTIFGMPAGSTRSYRVGDAIEVRVIDVSPSATPPPKGNVEKRQKNLRKAVDQADRTNAMIFASSFSGKWGDYDPAGFEIDDQKEDSGSDQTRDAE